MTERVRIAAEASPVDYAARFGYSGHTIASYLDDFGGWDATSTTRSAHAS